MRKLPGPDGKLRARACYVHRIFHWPVLHESRTRQKAHTEDERIPGHDRILHPGAPGGRFQSHRSSCGARNHPHRCHCIRMSDQHHDASGTPATKQPLRPRSGTLHILRLHPRLEQVRGTDSLPQLPGPRPILPCPVAAIHPRHPIPSRPGNAHHAVLIRHLISGLTHPFTTEELINRTRRKKNSTKLCVTARNHTETQSPRTRRRKNVTKLCVADGRGNIRRET